MTKSIVYLLAVVLAIVLYAIFGKPELSVLVFAQIHFTLTLITGLVRGEIVIWGSGRIDKALRPMLFLLTSCLWGLLSLLLLFSVLLIIIFR
jgi:hypothetical protein